MVFHLVQMNLDVAHNLPLQKLLFLFVSMQGLWALMDRQLGVNGNHQSLLAQLCYRPYSPKQKTPMNNSSQDTVRKNC